MKAAYDAKVHVITVYVIEPHPNASRSPYQRAWPDFANVTGWREWWNGYATSTINKGGRINPQTIEPAFPADPWATAESPNPWVNHPIFQPRTFKERVHQAASMIRHYALTNSPITTPVLVDEMDNRVWCSYGYLPNCAYLIRQDGTIVRRESWFARKTVPNPNDPTKTVNIVDKTAMEDAIKSLPYPE